MPQKKAHDAVSETRCRGSRRPTSSIFGASLLLARELSTARACMGSASRKMGAHMNWSTLGWQAVALIVAVPCVVAFVRSQIGQLNILTKQLAELERQADALARLCEDTKSRLDAMNAKAVEWNGASEDSRTARAISDEAINLATKAGLAIDTLDARLKFLEQSRTPEERHGGMVKPFFARGG